MGESGEALVHLVILLVVHVRLACGGEQAVVWCFLVPLQALLDKCVP